MNILRKAIIGLILLLPSVAVAKTSLEKAEASTVLISVEGFDGGWRGSGVLIDSMTVITCAHMAESKDDDLWVYIYPGDRVVKGKPRIENIGKDLAVVDLASPVELSNYATFTSNSEVGENIQVIGNTLGVMHWFVTSGIVSAYDHGYIVTDALIHGGNSGGPWVNHEGEVIALTDWGLENTGINGGVAGKDVIDFIKDVKHPKADMFRKDADATLTKYK